MLRYRHRVLGLLITDHQVLTVVLLSLVYGAITFQQSGVFGVCLDIGQRHAGSVVGLMNMSAQVGGLLCSIAYGYIVDSFGATTRRLSPWRCSYL